MATFVNIPDVGASKSVKPSVSKVKFGDGYEQRIQKGLNTQPQVWSLTFSARSETETNTIEAFFLARGGIEAFDWTPPGGTTALKWKCEEWGIVVGKGNLYNISATFIQVFEP